MFDVKKMIVLSSLGLCLSACGPLIRQQSASPAPTPLVDSYTNARNNLYTHITAKVPDANYTVTLTKDNLSADFGDQENKLDGNYGTLVIGDQVVEKEGVSFSTIAVNYGGSGEIFYIAAFEPSANGWLMTDTQELGDRIRTQSLKTTETGVDIQYLEHGPGQAMADAPTVQVNRSFAYADKKLSEVK